MSCFFDEIETKAVSFAGAVASESTVVEHVYRAGPAGGALAVEMPISATELIPLQLLSPSVPVALPCIPPALPSGPYFLESTHVRSVAPAGALFAALKRSLAAQPLASLSIKESNCKINVKMVKDYVGVEFVARIFSSPNKDLVVEFQCRLARGRAAFLAVFSEVVGELQTLGLVSEPVKRPSSPMKPLSLPEDLSAKPSELSCDSFQPIFAMVLSSCSSVRREGVALLTSLVCGSTSQAAAASAGAAAVLRKARSCVDAAAEFDTAANIATALSKLTPTLAC